MLFNRSTIFRAAWADARQVHANFTRNARIFGPAPSLQSCFSKALREAWATAKIAAAKAQAQQAARAAVAALPAAERARLAAAAAEAITFLDYSDSPSTTIAARRAQLTAKLAALTA